MILWRSVPLRALPVYTVRCGDSFTVTAQGTLYRLQSVINEYVEHRYSVVSVTRANRTTTVPWQRGEGGGEHPQDFGYTPRRCTPTGGCNRCIPNGHKQNWLVSGSQPTRYQLCRSQWMQHHQGFWNQPTAVSCISAWLLLTAQALARRLRQAKSLSSSVTNPACHGLLAIVSGFSWYQALCSIWTASNSRLLQVVKTAREPEAGLCLLTSATELSGIQDNLT